MIVQSELLKIKKKITTFYLMSRLQRCALIPRIKDCIFIAVPNYAREGLIKDFEVKDRLNKSLFTASLLVLHE